MKEKDFTLVGIREQPAGAAPAKIRPKDLPVLSLAVLALILLGCLACELVITKDPGYLDLAHCTQPPDREFLFGTDTLGRDIFSMIWYGGRLSLTVGLAATAVSTAIAVILGAVSGCGPRWLDGLLMRLTEILLSVPGLLVVVLLQAVLGEASALSLALVIGAVSWTSVAKVVRTEVRQLRSSEYVVASRCMGGGFFHILWTHLAPNFFPSILFMVVMNVRSAIVMESTLSFMGIGLAVETVSWGSMLSLSERALSANAWWMILIPGAFLAATLLCMTNIGNYLRRRAGQRESSL